ncbi:invasion associated locus B family protein [Bradyrhizobium sp. U87765 SZCCT0131]|uniref:invasion associated locus B family protein n=1 Tax=unclassified Bradyrhizobium TaxID=2631580 RepID=UPI001BA8817E|nr:MULTISPECIES: invasion associated locus B family protein [unclassified Bradyrhizobium]MBR1219281.1 invasion associated locus B family protein [Bradyrhizobium sp. U87765 SZCCT0131]MBR1261932.1 invasion associated locus B family protein [Bradyrhizobium sp. U87765 SZCCT0134]MBR1306215.1 invasion associated locus B family protein [Bradyrhizobium sp. U87765 SZCCT0110]MBR1317714.1 invasion associated locus B family protein [Bradyrhizobium sp. U87765 SZCCT0109]MBR1351416.1 invasion associated locu
MRAMQGVVGAPLKPVARILAAVASLALVALSSAVAEPSLAYGPWQKTCFADREGGANCWVTIDASGACIPSGGVVMVGERLDNGMTRQLALMIAARKTPLRRMRVLVDGANMSDIANPGCRAGTCSGRSELTADDVVRLRKGHVLSVESEDAGGHASRLVFPLDGFAVAYDKAEPPQAPLGQIELTPRQRKHAQRLAKAHAERNRIACAAE